MHLLRKQCAPPINTPVQVCNDPLTSRLHVDGADAALADHCVPASVQLGGKMAMLTHLLQRLVPTGALRRARSSIHRSFCLLTQSD